MNIKYYFKYLPLVILIISIVLFNSYYKPLRIYDAHGNFCLLNAKMCKKEGFNGQRIDNNDWPTDLIQRFNIYQTTVNTNNNQYNLDVLQKQASPEEAEQLLATGYWPWPDELKYLYMDKIWSSTIIKIQPQFALDYAMKTYNENAARQLLAWNTKEGEFLLYGANLGVTEGMPKDVHNTLKCSVAENGNSVLEKKIYTGMNFRNGYMNTTVTTVKDEDIPKEMVGFSFVKGVCNPCGPLNSEPDFSCPFRLNVEGDDQISSVWKTLWSSY